MENKTTKSWIILLWIYIISSVKCKECTRQEFLDSDDYHDTFDVTGLGVSYALKREVRVPCMPGYTGFFKLICTESGWTTRGDRCQPKPCGHPGDGKFNDFRLESGVDYVFGSTVIYTCYPGYRMVSQSNRRRCMSDGWDGRIPVCEAVSCEPFDVADNVLVTSGEPEDGSYGSVVRFKCRTHQILKGSKEIHCNEHGQWSANPPECKEVSCEAPQIHHGRVTDGPKVYKENEVVNFRCNQNYKREDHRDSKCIKVGMEAVWSPTPKCLPIQCRVILPPIAGTTFNRYNQDIFLPGDTLTVTCEGDRWISDVHTTRAEVTCGVDGNWDIFPECKDVTCRDRRNHYLNWFYARYGTKAGDTATYACKWGFAKPQGVDVATCTRDGWMPERLCEGTSCIKPTLDENAVVTSRSKNSYNNGDRLIYTCTNDAELSVTITCERGSWSGIKSCSERACKKPEIANGFAVGPINNIIYYSCDYNYKLYSDAWWGMAKCTSGQWSKLQQCIGKNECGAVPLIPNGRVRALENNQRARIDCNEGFQSEINEEITCVNGEWDLQEPTNVCTRILNPCGPPPEVENAIVVEPYQKEFESDSSVTYKCRDSYSLGEDKTINCINGTWEEKNITCTVFCKPLEGDELTILATKEKYFNQDTITYRCKYLTEVNEGTATCSDGQWTKTLNCPGMPCKVPPMTPGLSVTPNLATLKLGEKLKFFCNARYELEGVNEVECSDNGRWSSDFPTCSETCELPQVPQYLRQITVLEGRVKKGQKVKYECKQRGKYMQGKAEIECKADGYWSHAPPTCENQRTCTNPPSIEHGDVFGSKPVFTEGEQAEYFCPSYYEMEGGPYLTCKGGQWTGRIRCIKPCTVTKEMMDINNIEFKKHWLQKIYAKHNDHLTFQCKDGKEHDGQRELRQKCVEGVIPLPNCV